MKKILFILVCVMATMTTMGQEAQQAQQAPAEKSTNLSQGQWNHGLAIGAQWIATDLGFAQAEDKVISRTNENYSLDDLKTMYNSRANWMAYYDKLKKHENEGGDINKLIETIAAEYEKGAVIKNGVKRDVEKYNASHTGDEVNTQASAQQAAPADAQQNGNEAAAQPADAASSNDAQAAQDEEAKNDDNGGNDSSHGLLYILTILGLALGAIGTFLAMQARKESQAMMHDNRDDINNMQKQIDKLRAALKSGAAMPAMHARNDKRPNKNDEKDAPAQSRNIEFGNRQAQNKPAEKKQEPKKADEPRRNEQPKKADEPKKEPATTAAMGEPRILFMAKPDENDNFSRSSSQYEPGNSIFELTTMNGKSGSFTVINKAEAHKLALLMPGDTLTRACSGNNIQSTAGKSRIITDRAGRAQLENGKWHIVVKAIVHYD